MSSRSRLALATAVLLGAFTFSIGVAAGGVVFTPRPMHADTVANADGHGTTVITEHYPTALPFVDTSVVYRIPQAYYSAQTGAGEVGGRVEYCTVATDTIFAGELVYISATGPTCRRTTSTTATHIATVGVAVTGASVNMKGVTDSASVANGQRLALPGAKVGYCSQCKAWVRADTGSGGSITAGVRLRGPTYLGGRLGAWTTASGDSGKTVGIALRTGTAGNVFLAHVTR